MIGGSTAGAVYELREENLQKVPEDQQQHGTGLPYGYFRK